MNTLERIKQTARDNQRCIVLPEATDPRVIDAAGRLAEDGIARIILVGSRASFPGTPSRDLFDHDRITVIDPADAAQRDRLAAVIFEARKHKGISEQDARQLATDPLVVGAAMVRNGDADGMVAGAAHPTANVVRAALQLVGMDQESKIVSSFFLMQHDLPHQAIQGTVIYADCAMVIDPSADELACIAIDSARSATRLAGIDPKIALLSFSTAGSAEHTNVAKVREAGRIIQKRAPELALMTEVQFDAAIISDILTSKAPDIVVEAPANIFIFPELQSGNIGYKIAQRIGGVQAIGPILQGLKRPVNDLSRGCSADDIVNLVAVTSVQASE